ncbi:MAG: nitroreductase family protein [Hyphomicrobiales bacterium]|nr:nitroreductase family protein [Hyphomicrobiales bacterium]
MTSTNPRKAEYGVAPLFLDRWSPRAFTGEPIGKEQLLQILEAAHWAPSASNSQPWRFVIAHRDTPEFETLLSLLAEGNRIWAHRAAALIVLVSKKTFRPAGADEDVPARWHSFDAGAAWGYLALQASMLGWSAHGMAGFDAEAARRELNIPADHHPEIAIAIGKRGDKSVLAEGHQKIEQPNGRAPLTALVINGAFPKR